MEEKPLGQAKLSVSYTHLDVYKRQGLNISCPVLCGIKDWINDDGSRYMVLFYKTNVFEGQLLSSDEGEVYWIKIRCV